LQGIPTLDLEMVQAKKSIATTRTFDSNYTEYEQVKERVTTFAVSCAEKLRKQNACCDSLMVFVRTNRHRPDAPQYARSITVQLPFPSNSGIEVAKAAVRALDQIFVAGYQYKKAGVVIMDFKPESEVQLNLFENSDPRHVPIMKTLDKLNAIYGQQKVKLASQDPKRVWKMRQERLSPRYTTRLNDIITIRL
jgi:DNA polymerase V